MMFFVSLVIVLIVGDLGSTFLYHIPQHLWFKLHLRTHHDRNRSYWDHAILSKDPEILLDGLLGPLPSIDLALPFCSPGPWAAEGPIRGHVLGQPHVGWRPTVEIAWSSPP